MRKTTINSESLLGFDDMFEIELSTDNSIGETGVKSLSESLKSNTTLTELNLSSEDRRKKAHKRHPSTIHSSFSHHINREHHWRKRSSIIE